MGIQINGATDSITAIDGTIDVVSAIGNAGVVTATAFVGNITGNVTGNINHTSALELQTGGVTRAHFNSSGHFGIAGISTFSDDVKFTGNNYNVLWDKSDDSLKFDALAKIKLNDSFQFYHNTNGVIHNTAGITFIYGSGSGNISLQAQSGAQNISCAPNGGTSLYYQGSQKLYTVSDGIYVNDNLGIQDSIQHILDTNTKIRFPANDTISFETGGVQRLQLDATEAFFNSTGSNTDFRVRSPAQGHLFFVDAGNDQVTIKTSSAQSGAVLTVNGRTHIDTQLTLGSNSTLDAGAQATIYKPATNTLAFATAGANERLRITSGGKVLIGGGSSPTQVGDGQLIVYADTRLHPAIKADCIDGGSNRANGFTLLADNYLADESICTFGISYSGANLVLARGCKVSNTADNAFLSSMDSFAIRPCALVLDDDGALTFNTTENTATTATDSAVSLTEVFKVDRVGNIYQRISARSMYFGASNQLRIGVQSNGDPNIEAVSGNLKIMDSGTTIMQLRPDGFEMKKDIYFGTAGMGIVLGNTSNVDANTLDNYEEGTFTPTVLNGWGILNSNPQISTGKYIRIGAIVYIYFTFKEGSGTGASFNGNRLALYTFPFNPDGTFGSGGGNNFTHPLQAYTNSNSSNGENVIGVPGSNGATVFSYITKASNGYGSFTGNDLSSSGTIFCAGTYRITGT